MKKLLISIITLIFVVSCFVIKEQPEQNNSKDIQLQSEAGSAGQGGEEKQKYAAITLETSDTINSIPSLEIPDSISSEYLSMTSGKSGGRFNTTQVEKPNNDLIFGWSTANGEINLVENESKVKFNSKESNCSFIKLIEIKPGTPDLNFKYCSDQEAELIITYLTGEHNLNQNMVLNPNQDFTEKDLILSQVSEQCNILIKIILKPHSYLKIGR